SQPLMLGKIGSHADITSGWRGHQGRNHHYRVNSDILSRDTTLRFLIGTPYELAESAGNHVRPRWGSRSPDRVMPQAALLASPAGAPEGTPACTDSVS